MGGPVSHILDWWDISMRVRHIEQALAGINTLRPTFQAGLDYVSTDVERIRRLIWNGYGVEAGQVLWALTHLASEAIYLNGEHTGPAVRRFLLHCQELRAYLAYNQSALVYPLSGSAVLLRVNGQDVKEGHQIDRVDRRERALTIEATCGELAPYVFIDSD